MRHVVMFSGGIASWCAAKRIAERHGADALTLLFADVRGTNPEPHVGEDEDTYRWLPQAAANVGAELVTVCEGRNIWQVFEDKRYLGNSRRAPCSYALKIKPCRRWLEARYAPDEATVHVGISWYEIDRLDAIRRRWLPYTATAPLTEPPYLDRQDMLDWAKREGLTPPRLYALGAQHNNCGGGCVKSGQASFRRLLLTMPERYADWERREAEIRAYLGKPVTILRETTGDEHAPLTLKEFRERIEATPALFDLFDEGGCNCFTADDDEDEP